MNFSLFILFIGFSIISYGQELISEEDSAFLNTDAQIELFQEQSNLDPRRSALLSAVLPGLGQVYNKQYWKVPLVVTGIVAFGHLINNNNRLYHAFRNATILATDNDESTTNPYATSIGSENALESNRDNLRRNRDYMIILGTVFYLLQIVDAHVSAHLEEFNVNEELQIGFKPSIQSSTLNSQANIGLTFYINL